MCNVYTVIHSQFFEPHLGPSGITEGKISGTDMDFDTLHRPDPIQADEGAVWKNLGLIHGQWTSFSN